MKTETSVLPEMSVEQLDVLWDKIYENTALPEEYELLDQFLVFIGNDDFLRKKLFNAGVSDYKDFIRRRKSGYDRNINKATGAAMAVAENFKRYIAGTLWPRYTCPFARCQIQASNNGL